jgi:hypothetical protein
MRCSRASFKFKFYESEAGCPYDKELIPFDASEVRFLDFQTNSPVLLTKIF